MNFLSPLKRIKYYNLKYFWKFLQKMKAFWCTFLVKWGTWVVTDSFCVNFWHWNLIIEKGTRFKSWIFRSKIPRFISVTICGHGRSRTYFFGFSRIWAINFCQRAWNLFAFLIYIGNFVFTTGLATMNSVICNSLTA